MKNRKTWPAILIACCALGLSQHCQADDSIPPDARTGTLRDLNGYFPMHQVETVDQWKRRQAEIRRRILVSQGLWPLPTKSPLQAVIHGRVERSDYVVDRVFFQSGPDHYVTGSLYRPKSVRGPMPAILSPHGHWNQGRFYDAGEDQIRKQIESAAESYPVSGRYPIQARAVQLARMGCAVFVYDMTGYADSVQLPHRSSRWRHLDRAENWGFMSVQADLRLQNPMGLQTWNSIRAIDFLLELDGVDPNRIGVTGASGGGTQSMIVAAVDDRIAAAMPCVMVSTAMQGGCSCENAPLLRIDQGNVDIAAAIAPRPLGLTAADDWTVELETKGFPELVRLYQMLGHRDRLTAAFHTQYKHNYNQVNRLVMYSFFNRHFGLGAEEPIQERDFEPLSRDEATVWTDQHPSPSGDRIGDVHEVQLLSQATAGTKRQMQRLIPSAAGQLENYQSVVGGAWKTILGRSLADVGSVTFAETNRRSLDQMTLRSGRIEHQEQGERLPAVEISPANESVGTLIWVSDTGKDSLIKDGQPTGTATSLVNSGFTLIAADLFGQGEFLPTGGSLNSQRLNSPGNGDSWRDFSGYTYGYNHSLFALRTHDVLSLIKYAQSKNQPIHLVGLGRAAGPLVAAATSQAVGAVAAAVVDADGFSFASIDRHDHPMFVPGAVKYFDLDGLLSLAAPTRLQVIGGAEPAVTARVYRAANGADRFHHAGQKMDLPSVVEWISR